VSNGFVPLTSLSSCATHTWT